MQKKQVFYLTVLALAVLLVSASVIVLDSLDPYKFKADQRGVLFKAKSLPPGNQLSALAAADSFLLVPSFYEGSTVNSYVGPAWILFRTVLAANGKQTESVFRVYDKGKQLVKCQVDSKTQDNQEVSATECGALLASSQAVHLFIELPDAGLLKPEVVVESNAVTVKPKSVNDVSPVSRVLLEFMFPNTGEVIAKSNDLLKQLKN